MQLLFCRFPTAYLCSQARACASLPADAGCLLVKHHRKTNVCLGQHVTLCFAFTRKHAHCELRSHCASLPADAGCLLVKHHRKTNVCFAAACFSAVMFILFYHIIGKKALQIYSFFDFLDAAKNEQPPLNMAASSGVSPISIPPPGSSQTNLLK